MKVGDYVVLDGMSSANGIPKNGQLKAAIEEKFGVKILPLHSRVILIKKKLKH